MANRPRATAPSYDDPLTGHLPRQWVAEHAGWAVKPRSPFEDDPPSRPPGSNGKTWLLFAFPEVWVCLGIVAAGLITACATVAERVARALNQLTL